MTTLVIAGVVVGVAVVASGVANWPDLPVLALGGVALLGMFTGPRRVAAVCAAGILVAAFMWTYVTWVVPSYSYSGLIDSHPPLGSLALIAFLAAVPSVWLPLEVMRPSTVVLWVLYLCGYVPSVVLPIYVLGPDIWHVLPFVTALLAGFLCTWIVTTVPLVRLPPWQLSSRGFAALLGAMGLAALAYYVVSFGIPSTLPDFVQIYDVRSQFGATATDVAGAGYVVTWAERVVFPLLIAVGMRRRTATLILIGLLGEVMVYAGGGFKSALVDVLLVPVLFVCIDRWPRRFGMTAVVGTLALIALAVAVTAVTTSIEPLALGVVRPFALPGQLASYYYDYFSRNETYQLSRSILRLFTHDPYGVDAPYLIGSTYLHGSVDANANIWADAIANFGLLGVVPFSALLGGVLWLLDCVSRDRDIAVVGALMGMAGLGLANGALFTQLLTSGLGLTILIVAVMPRLGSTDQPASIAVSSA